MQLKQVDVLKMTERQEQYIYKEVETNLDLVKSNWGCLIKWLTLALRVKMVAEENEWNWWVCVMFIFKPFFEGEWVSWAGVKQHIRSP